MQRSIVSKYLPTTTRIVNPLTPLAPPKQKPPCEIFINHRGVDTKRTIAGLLHQHLSDLGYNPFLDKKSMKPGDKLFEKIDPAIKKCRVGVAIFSRRYCESYFCLHELALMMECKKKVIPIFWDVKPSELQIKNNVNFSSKEIERFQRAIEEAKNIVGLTFDTSNGDWAEFLRNAANAVRRSLIEVDDEKGLRHKITKYHAI